MKKRSRTLKNNYKNLFRCVIPALLCICLLWAAGCTVRQILPTGADDRTTGAFQKAVIHKFDADRDVDEAFPSAATLCENAAFEELLQIGFFPMIVKASSPASVREPATVIVKVRLTYRDAISQSRAKAKTGTQNIVAEVRLIDAANGKAFHSEFVPARGVRSSSLPGNPAELGKMIARHICQVVQNQ